MITAKDSIAIGFNGAVSAFLRALQREHPVLSHYRFRVATTADRDHRKMRATVELIDEFRTVAGVSIDASYDASWVEFSLAMAAGADSILAQL